MKFLVHVLLVILLLYLLFSKPKTEMFLSASCYDQNWLVQLHRTQRLFGVEVSLKVFTSFGNLILDDAFDVRDVWGDEKRRHTIITCDADFIKVGEKHWSRHDITN